MFLPLFSMIPRRNETWYARYDAHPKGMRNDEQHRCNPASEPPAPRHCGARHPSILFGYLLHDSARSAGYKVRANGFDAKRKCCAREPRSCWGKGVLAMLPAVPRSLYASHDIFTPLGSIIERRIREVRTPYVDRSQDKAGTPPAPRTPRPIQPPNHTPFLRYRRLRNGSPHVALWGKVCQPREHTDRIRG